MIPFMYEKRNLHIPSILLKEYGGKLFLQSKIAGWKMGVGTFLCMSFYILPHTMS